MMPPRLQLARPAKVGNNGTILFGRGGLLAEFNVGIIMIFFKS